ncbi:hypothetical protein HED48_12270 [Ochrobactrum intermedium]|nr:hypothetical protein [Brucella intermedia]
MQIGGNGGQSGQIHIDRKWANGGKKAKNNGIAHKTGSHGDALSSMFREIPAPISDLRFCLGGWRHRARKIGTGQINLCIRFEFSFSLNEVSPFWVVADI